MPKLKTNIKLATYTCGLSISVVDSVCEEVDKLYKKHKIQDVFGSEAEGAVVMIGMQQYHILYHKDYLTHNTIAHEVFHATVRITEDREITDEEAQAWLMGHITALVYKFLDKKKLTVKHG